MPEEYTKEQFWKLYEKLPEELKEAIFSVETSDHIWDTCERNDIEEVSDVAKYVGQVLVGVLPPEEFQETLEKELKLEKETAKKAAQEIYRSIFYPVRSFLEELYKIEIAPSAKPTGAVPLSEEKPPAPPKEDIYRETIE